MVPVLKIKVELAGALQFRKGTIPQRNNSAKYGFVTILPFLFATLLDLRPLGKDFLPDDSITQSPRPIITTAAISHRSSFEKRHNLENRKRELENQIRPKLDAFPTGDDTAGKSGRRR